MKKDIRICFVDFFDDDLLKYENLFEEILSKHYNIIYDQENPDLAICTVFGNSRYTFKANKKLLWLGENERPDLLNFDYCIGFDYLNDDRYLRFPLWKYYLHLNNRKELLVSLLNKEIQYNKNNFAAFVVSSPTGDYRNQFYNKLSKYKHIDSFGHLYNNRSEILRIRENSLIWQTNKINYLRSQNYKFIISMENSSYPGYTTEKLVDVMLCGSVPIYWGDILVGKDFNEKSFINTHNFESIDKVIEYVKYLDNNDDAYYKLLEETWLTLEQELRITKNEMELFLLKIVG